MARSFSALIYCGETDLSESEADGDLDLSEADGDLDLSEAEADGDLDLSEAGDGLLLLSEAEGDGDLDLSEAEADGDLDLFEAELGLLDFSSGLLLALSLSEAFLAFLPAFLSFLFLASSFFLSAGESLLPLCLISLMQFWYSFFPLSFLPLIFSQTIYFLHSGSGFLDRPREIPIFLKKPGSSNGFEPQALIFLPSLVQFFLSLE